MGSDGVQKLGLQKQFLQDLGLGMVHLEFSHHSGQAGIDPQLSVPQDPRIHESEGWQQVPQSPGREGDQRGSGHLGKWLTA